MGETVRQTRRKARRKAYRDIAKRSDRRARNFKRVRDDELTAAKAYLRRAHDGRSMR